jgi:hypothetical protein
MDLFEKLCLPPLQIQSQNRFNFLAEISHFKGPIGLIELITTDAFQWRCCVSKSRDQRENYDVFP